MCFAKAVIDAFCIEKAFCILRQAGILEIERGCMRVPTSRLRRCIIRKDRKKMKKQTLLIRLSLVLTLCLLVAAVSVGCGEQTPPETTGTSDVQPAPAAEPIGEGQYTFAFTAVFADGSAKRYAVSTDRETVGEALIELKLIEGEAGPYGLYVKSVCGVVADYNIDGTYWSLYTDGEMSMTGVDSLGSADAVDIEFRVEK